MKTLIAFSLFALLHLVGWGAAHAWLSANKKQTLVVVDTSFAMKPHFSDMQRWIEEFKVSSRYTTIVIGTEKAAIGPLDNIKSTESIFRASFGKFSAESLEKYAATDSDRKILLSNGSVDPGDWETVEFN